MFRKRLKMDIDQDIIWEGDLDDDCLARWNGLLLRAEWMDEDEWWWAVSIDSNGYGDEIDSQTITIHPLKVV